MLNELMTSIFLQKTSTTKIVKPFANVPCHPVQNTVAISTVNPLLTIVCFGNL